MSERPIRFFHGSADDYTPVAPCLDYVQQLRKAGKDVLLTEYPGAYHLFDNPLVPVGPRPAVQHRWRCKLDEDPSAEITNLETGKRFTWSDACVGRGVTVGYDLEAHRKATEAVKELFRTAFHLR